MELNQFLLNDYIVQASDLDITRSHDSLIFNMAIPIPGKDGLYIETGPWYLHSRYAGQE